MGAWDKAPEPEVSVGAYKSLAQPGDVIVGVFKSVEFDVVIEKGTYPNQKDDITDAIRVTLEDEFGAEFTHTAAGRVIRNAYLTAKPEVGNVVVARRQDKPKGKNYYLDTVTQYKSWDEAKAALSGSREVRTSIPDEASSSGSNSNMPPF